MVFKLMDQPPSGYQNIKLLTVADRTRNLLGS
jgi:hypothetical protein